MNNLLNTKNVSPSELKEFGLLMTWAFPLFIGVIAPWFLGKGLQWWTLWVSLCFILPAFLAPKLIYYPFRTWMYVASIIGFINTRLILGLTFYLLIFPIGIALRLTNKLQYKKNNKSRSNYVIRDEKLDKKRLEHPF